jgi:hypothetical protein
MSPCHSPHRSRFALLGGTRQHKARAGLTRHRPGLEALEERRLLSGGAPTFPEHYPNIRIAELAYSNSPPDSTEDQLLRSSVDLVVPDVSQLSAINAVAPDTPQMIYSNVSSVYQQLLLSWDNYAEANGISPENAFYHAAVPTPFSGNSSDSQPVDWFWAVYNSGTSWTDNTWAAHESSGEFSLAPAGQATYIGYPEEFAMINLQLASPGSNWQGTFQYPTAVDSKGNPTSWATLSLDTDTTSGLAHTGQITFAPPPNWVPATVNGYGRLYYVRIESTGTGTSSAPPQVQSLLDDDYVDADGGTSGTIPVYDYAADVKHTGYLTDAEYAVAVAAGDTARFAYQSRMFYPGDGQMRFATDPSNTYFRAWAVSYDQGLLAANPLAAGIFMDNSDADPQIAPSSVIESISTYAADYGSLLGAIDQAIAPRWILANVAGGYQNSEIPAVQATSAYFEESFLRPLADNYETFLNDSALVSQLESTTSPAPYGVLDSSPANGSPTDPRTQIATLAEYDLLEVPNDTFLDFYGGYAPASDWSQHWSPAAAYNIGQPTASWSVFATGTDPSNPKATYYVYQRPFKDGLVLYKPLSFENWSTTASIGSNSATTFQLKGSYYPLNANGTLGSAVTSITLDNGQGAILIPVPGPPTANNDSYTTPPNTTLSVPASIGVLENDTDPQNDPLTASLVGGPAHGSVALNSNGSFTYTPAAGFVGTVSFTYQDSDGTYLSNVATVSIAVAKSPVVSDPSYTACLDTTLTVPASSGLLANASDPNGLPLTAILVGGPTDGSLTLNSNGSFSYTPNAGFTGTDNFTFRVSDGVVETNPLTASINVQTTQLQTLMSQDFDSTATGSMPSGWSQWSNTGTKSFAVESAHSFDGPNGLATSGASNVNALTWYNTSYIANVRVSAEFLVNALNPVQIFARGSNLNSGSPSYYGVTIAGYMGVQLVKVVNGQSTVLASLSTASFFSGQWADVILDLSGSTLSVGIYCPSTEQYLNSSGKWQSAWTWGLVVSDSSITGGGQVGLARLAKYSGSVDFDDFLVQQVMMPPVVTNPVYSTDENRLLTVNAASGVLADDTDPNGGNLKASLVSGPADGTLTLNANGSFTYTPDAGFFGSDSFIYQATDTAGLATQGLATIDVVNPPPTPRNDADTTSQDGTLSVSAPGILANDTDAAGDPLTAALETGPSFGTLVLNSNGSFVYTPNPGFWGTDVFVYNAVDSMTGVAAPATVTITVNPIAVSQSFDTTAVGSLPSGWSQWSSTGTNSFAVSAAEVYSGSGSLASSGASSVGARTWYNNVLGANVQVSAEMYVASLIPMQIFARGTNLNTSSPTYYGVSAIWGIDASLVKVVNGQTTVIASLSSVKWFTGLWAEITLGVSGSNLEVQVFRPDTSQYLNSSGQWQSSATYGIVATDTSITGNGQVGLARVAQYSGSAYFDSFSAVALGSGTSASMAASEATSATSTNGIMALPATDEQTGSGSSTTKSSQTKKTWSVPGFCRGSMWRRPVRAAPIRSRAIDDMRDRIQPRVDRHSMTCHGS